MNEERLRLLAAEFCLNIFFAFEEEIDCTSEDAGRAAHAAESAILAVLLPLYADPRRRPDGREAYLRTLGALLAIDPVASFAYQEEEN